MRATSCLFNTSIALSRVFIAPIEQSQLRQCLRAINSNASRSTLRPAAFNLRQQRCIATSAPADKRANRLPRDHEIKDWTVILVGEDNSLSAPQSPGRILRQLDLSRQSLMQVMPSEEGQPPLCKIVDKKKLYAQSKAKAKNAKKSAVVSKVIELNWAIEGDLKHRLKRIRDFLEKGYKVEVVIAPKRKGKVATSEQAAEVVKQVRQLVNETAGARETRKMEGVVGAEVRFYLEGTAPKEEKSVEGKQDQGKKGRDVPLPGAASQSG